MRSDNFIGRGIVDYFFCFTCDQHVLDCDHLIEDRLVNAERVDAMEPSPFQSFAYNGRQRVLEVEWRVTTPFIHGEDPPLPPPPRAVQFQNVPRYVFARLIRCKTARSQELYLGNVIQRRYKCQTVRTVCRWPRIYRLRELVPLRQFDEHLAAQSAQEQVALRTAVTAMKVLLVKVLAPRRVAGLGGLLECQACGAVGATPTSMRHRNCLWLSVR